MRKFIVGIIGNGVVGSATARAYMEHCEVRVYDSDPTKSPHFLNHVLKSDIIFLCLPEAAVEEFLSSSLGDTDHCNRVLVIKSTMPIGATKELKRKYGLGNVVHSPEFLTERCAMLDAQIPARNIIGIPNWQQFNKDNDCFGHFELEELYKQRWPHVPIHTMSSDESEAVKLMQNSLFAIKVAAWNEMYSLSEKLGLNWTTIRNALLADGRIHPSHTQVPGPDGKRGFGGKCLPKDLQTLIDHQMAQSSGNLSRTELFQCLLTASASTRNQEIDRKEAQS